MQPTRVRPFWSFVQKTICAIGTALIIAQPLPAQAIQALSTAPAAGSIMQPGADCDGVTEIPSVECAALVSLFQNTAGNQWRDHSGWLENHQPCGWYGVRCAEGHVTGLLLHNNQLAGTLPTALGNLTGLKVLSLAENGLTGALPSELGNLVNLTFLGAWNNELAGTIPSQLSNLKALIVLDLSANHLSGSLPPALGELPALTDLWLRYNRLTGAVPASLGSLPNLQRLVLTGNDLRGSYPALTNLAQPGDLDEAEYNALDKPGSTTQTIAPATLRAGAITSSTVELLWTPIPYTGDGGHYEISLAASEADPYTVAGTTANKSSQTFFVQGLTPGTTYFLRLRSYTPAHPPQQNELFSEYTAPLAVTTLAPAQPPTTNPNAPDLTVSAVEVTQGVQNLANQMPLVQDRVTWVRAYVRSTLTDVPGVRARLRGLRNGVELPGSPLLAENSPITVLTSGGNRLNLNDSFQFYIPKEWRNGAVTFQVEINHDGAVAESSLGNNSLATTLTFYPAADLNLVMVPLVLYDGGDTQRTPRTYTVQDPTFAKLINLALRHFPTARINWSTVATPLTPNCGSAQTPRPCDLSKGADWSLALQAIEKARQAQEGVPLWFESQTQNHWVGMVHPSITTGGIAGLGGMPLKPDWRRFTAYYALAKMSDSGLPNWPWYHSGSAVLAHEVAHNFGMTHIKCNNTEANPTPLFPTPYPNCSLDTIDPAGFYGFDVFYTIAGLSSPTVISNDPNAPPPANAYPMMGYAFPEWMSPFKYCELMNKFGITCALYDYGVFASQANATVQPQTVQPAQRTIAASMMTAPATGPTIPDSIVVSGRITVTAGITPTADIESVRATDPITLPSMSPPAELADFYLTLKDDCSGASYDYLLNFVHLLPDQSGPGQVYEFTIVESDYASNFSLDCPSFYGLQASIHLILGPESVIQLPLTSHPDGVYDVDSRYPPTVTISAPTTAITLTVGTQIEWTASDEDCGSAAVTAAHFSSCELTFAVAYSADGVEWQTLAEGLAANRVGSSHIFTGALTLENVDSLPGSDHGVLRVTVDDSFWRAIATTSANLHTPNQPPQPVILQTTTAITQGNFLLLQALATDAEDGLLGDAQFSWQSSIDGFLGTGSELAVHTLSAGTHQITVTVTDANGSNTTASFTLDVAAAATNGAPTAAPDSAITSVDKPVGIPVLNNDLDPDGDLLSLALTVHPQHGVATTNGSVVYYTPNPGYTGNDSLTYTVLDGRGGTANATITVTVEAGPPQNQLPLAVNDNGNTTVDTQLTINPASLIANDSDADGDPLTVTQVSATSTQGGTVTLSSGVILYTPAPGFVGTDAFTYLISDGRGGMAAATVSIAVESAAQPNQAPVAINDTITTTVGTSLIISAASLLANDTDANQDSLTVTGVSATSTQGGTVTLNGNTILYTPAPGFVGNDSFTYTVSDGHGGTATGTVAVVVKSNITDVETRLYLPLITR